MFRASSTDLRLETNKIFPVIAVVLLIVDTWRERGASRCRFDVSTAFRGSRLHSNQRINIIMFWLQRCPVSHVLGRVQQDGAKVGLGLRTQHVPLVTVDCCPVRWDAAQHYDILLYPKSHALGYWTNMAQANAALRLLVAN
jgi:hypothetical protein